MEDLHETSARSPSSRNGRRYPNPRDSCQSSVLSSELSAISDPRFPVRDSQPREGPIHDLAHVKSGPSRELADLLPAAETVRDDERLRLRRERGQQGG